MKNRKHLKSPNGGFALIATISVMVLLVMIALAMLSLSTLELRASNHQAAQYEAKANARMALMLAIGDLQKTLGVDRAVTARSSFVDINSAQPNALGVWDSWRWQPSLSGSPNYSEKADGFQQWLKSKQNHEDQADPDMVNSDLAGDFGDDWQWVVNPDTLGALNRAPSELYSDPGVKVELVNVDGNRSGGSYGWAVMDQSMAASIRLNKKNQVGSAVGPNIVNRVAPARVRVDALSP